MKRFNFLSLVILLALVGRLSAADESPRAIVERAIKAHGGQEVLEKLKAERVTLKGTILLNDKYEEFTEEKTVNLPAQFRSVTQVMLEKKTITVVHVFDDNKSAVTIDGQPIKVVPSAQDEMRQIMLLSRAERLTALLTDKAFELSSLGESIINEKAAVGVKVRAKNQADLKMYFDKETGLLVKTEHELEESGKKVTQEEFYSEFKDVGGYKRAMKLSVSRKGKKFLEADVIEIKYLEKVDETLFTKP